MFPLLVAVGGYAQDQKKDYVGTLREYLDVSGSSETMLQIIPQMIDMMRQQMPSVTPEMWDELQKEVDLSVSNELVLMLTPIYQKYLTQDDLEAIIAFYKSPVGIKIASVQPQISSEAMEVGQQWGMQIGMKVYEKLKANGLVE